MTVPGTKGIAALGFCERIHSSRERKVTSAAKKEQEGGERNRGGESSKIKIYASSLPRVCDYDRCFPFFSPLNPHNIA